MSKEEYRAKAKLDQKRLAAAEQKTDYTKPLTREQQDEQIRKYYTQSAHELKIVFDCFVAEGFTVEQAFEMTKLLVPKQ